MDIFFGGMKNAPNVTEGVTAWCYIDFIKQRGGIRYLNGRHYHGAGITLVCIDSYENGVLIGRMYNNRYGEAESFRSTVGFLNKMEQLLDIENRPQAFKAVRTFGPAIGSLPDPPAMMLPREGKLATLELHILFRQNASWQGSIRWLDKEKEQHFRSVLELIFLIDSALSGAAAVDNEYPA